MSSTLPLRILFGKLLIQFKMFPFLPRMPQWLPGWCPFSQEDRVWEYRMWVRLWPGEGRASQGLLRPRLCPPWPPLHPELQSPGLWLTLGSTLEPVGAALLLLDVSVRSVVGVTPPDRWCQPWEGLCSSLCLGIPTEGTHGDALSQNLAPSLTWFLLFLPVFVNSLKIK